MSLSFNLTEVSVHSGGRPATRNMNGPPRLVSLNDQFGSTALTYTVGRTFANGAVSVTRTPDAGNGGATPSSVTIVPVTTLPVFGTSTMLSMSAPATVTIWSALPPPTM